VLLASFVGLVLFRVLATHPGDRSDYNQPSNYNSSCQDFSGDSPAKRERDKGINVGMS
jgi:hypothetical protein